EQGQGGYARRRAAVRFERVLGAQLHGIDLANKAAVLALLAISFEPAETPEGHVTLHFADGAAIRLHVERIEAELKDLGPVWQAKSKPQHPDEDPAKAWCPDSEVRRCSLLSSGANFGIIRDTRIISLLV